MLHDKWLTARLAYLRALEAPSEQQQQLVLLAGKLKRTDADSRILTALIKAEAAAERAQRVKAEAARLTARDEEAARILEAIDRETASRERDQELYNAAELLILAGLVDPATRAPAFDRGSYWVLCWGWQMCRQRILEDASGSVPEMHCSLRKQNKRVIHLPE